MIQSITKVESLTHTGLEQYRTLRRGSGHRKNGLFVVEGNKVVQRFLESQCEVYSMLITDSWLETCRDTLVRRPEPVSVFTATEKMIASIVGFRYHQGIMAIGKVPPGESLENICLKQPFPRLLVAFDALTSAENCGTIIRNCAACGVTAVISGESSTDPWLRRSVRNSMGAIFTLPVLYSRDLAVTLAHLRERFGFSLVAAHPRPGSALLHTVDLSGDCCIIFGHEDLGVSDKVVAQCTVEMKIPMDDRVKSFNVACASAIILYETYRQQGTLRRI